MNAIITIIRIRIRRLLVMQLCVLPLSGLAVADDSMFTTLTNTELPNPAVTNTGPGADDLSSALQVLPTVRQDDGVESTQFTEPLDQRPTGVQPGFGPEEIPQGFPFEEEVSPIDLPSVLALAGASNLQIALAAERVNAAAARADAAGAMWIPSLNGGLVWNNHSGQIQATEGEVINVNRNSLFVGGGAVMGTSPANGGSSGPARMFVDLPLVDAIFEPLAARQIIRAARADRTATFNDVLLEASSTYYNLVRAEGRVAIAEEAVRNADELVKITGDFAVAGRGLQADADRAEVEAASRRRDVLSAQEDRAMVSAELSRILRLDAAMRLAPTEKTPAPVEFIPPAASLRPLIFQAVGARPEARRADAERDAAGYRVRQEKLRPWLPHLYAGASGGGFGGGVGSDINNFDDRADFDVAALWEVQNLGFGNAALRRETRSLYRQTNLAVQQVRDIIATEVAQAYQRMQLRLQQMEVTQPQIQTAQQALARNLDGIRGGELRPIEIQQAIGALATAERQYLDAVIDYNIAQVQLLRSVGRTPDATSGLDVP